MKGYPEFVAFGKVVFSPQRCEGAEFAKKSKTVTNLIFFVLRAFAVKVFSLS